jgi:hypothetical protein
MRRILWVLLAVLALALSPPVAAAQGKSQGKGKSEQKGKSTQQVGQAKGKEKSEQAKESEEEKERERERHAAEGRAFGKQHEKIIRDFFGHPANLEGLPPGLAKREELPPGLQRHLERDGTLPPGLQKRLQPFPKNLKAKLPKTPAGVKRGIINGNVVLIEERTSKVLDILNDVVGGGRTERSTGVRRTN